LAKKSGGALPAAQPTSGSGDAMVDVLRPIDENSLLWLSQQPVGRMPPRPVEELRPYRPSPFQRIGNFAQDAMQGAGMDRYAAHTLRGQLFGAQGDKGRGIGVADFVPGLDTSAAADDYRANPGLLTGAGVGLSMLPLVGGFAAKGIGRLGRGLLDDVPTSMFDVDPTMPAKLVNPEMRVFQGGPNLYGPDVPGTKPGLDSSKIGTGEGAQVYGHGHYLAENPDVGRGYKTSTSYADIKRKFLSELPQDADFDEAIDLAESGAFGDSGKRFIEALAADDWLGFDYPSQAISAALGKNIDNWDPSAALTKARENLGHLYEYDLPDETIAKMLDWDKPLSEQPGYVYEALRKGGLLADDASLESKMRRELIERINRRQLDEGPALQEWHEELGKKWSDDAPDADEALDMQRVIEKWWDEGGVDVYSGANRGSALDPGGASMKSYLESRFGSPAEAAMALREAGIPGIRYLDQGSRSGGAGTSNFVLFDDDAAKLLARDDTRFDLPTDEASRMARGMSEDEFIQHHRTGYIAPSAYERYEADGGLSWLGGPKVEPITELPSNYTLMSDRGTYYISDDGPTARNLLNRAYDTPEDATAAMLKRLNDERGVGRAKDEIYPEVVEKITGRDGKEFDVRRSEDGMIAFDGDKPVGFSSNEFGTAGVWVEGPYQGQGIGSELLARFMREHPNMRIGQMTPAGENMSRAAYRKLTALPSDEASRMARAQEMGFDVDAYHGTGSDFDEFDGVSFFGDPKTASSYAADRGYGGGANVMPVKLKIRNPATDDDIFAAAKNAGVYESDLPAFTYISPNVVGPEQSKKVLDILKGQGFDGAKVSDYGMDDPFNSVTSWATFDPKNIRSRFAKFDPAKKDSANILAGLGVVGAGAALSQQDGFDYGALRNVAEGSNGQRSN
jgi:GNAT superfamily N-acetyltransferase